MLHGSCHCGAIRVEVSRRPRSITECNCSLCRRYGVRWAYYSHRTARVVARRGSLSKYQWGNRTLELFHCRHCGCVSHHERTRKRPDSTVAVNVRLFDPAELGTPRLRRFDGASIGSTTF